MATRSSILAWRIPWTEEPGGLDHGVTKSRTLSTSGMREVEGEKGKDESYLSNKTNWITSFIYLKI